MDFLLLASAEKIIILSTSDLTFRCRERGIIYSLIIQGKFTI